MRIIRNKAKQKQSIVQSRNKKVTKSAENFITVIPILGILLYTIWHRISRKYHEAPAKMKKYGKLLMRQTRNPNHV